MANNAYYFSHDSNAKDDPKCMLLIDQLGLEGYGIFWILIEVLRDQPEYRYPLNLVPILARRYNTTAEKMNTVIRNYNLFQFDEKNNFFSLSLNKRMNKIQIGIEQRKLAGLASAQKRLGQGVSTDVQRPFNECSTKKRKEKKGNENKEKDYREILVSKFKDEINPDFKEVFFKWLDYKKDRKESYKSASSAELAYKNLLKLSANNTTKANEIVEQSMANNWAGLFELKTNQAQSKPAYQPVKSVNDKWKD